MSRSSSLRAPALALALGAFAAGSLSPSTVEARAFESGALIIPMDTTYQDEGMLEAFGLVYQLLLADVRVHWVIKEGKGLGEADLMASGTDMRTGAVIPSHGYRGGPWVIAPEDADIALPIVEQWLADNPATTVHVLDTPFQSDVAHLLVAAPNIAMVADGNEDIARQYLLAAKIPDSLGDLTWPDESPDMLDIEELKGPTETSHSDGALFDDEGNPVYCQLMSMHWAVNDAEDNPEVVAEVREFLSYPTHLFAECQAVNAFENSDPHGFFLTPAGFEIGQGPDAYDFYDLDSPFAQHDGQFESVGGSEPAYTLAAGTEYKGMDTVMITRQGTPIGHDDVWMTGFVDGICPQSAYHYQNSAARDIVDSPPNPVCLSVGKVSYLGGHAYSTDVPISQNPTTVGARLFLNSLFEAPCATEGGAPVIEIEKAGPANTDVAEVTYTIDYAHLQGVTAMNAVLFDTLPAGASFVSASDGGVLNGDTVEWELGNVGMLEGGELSLTVNLPEWGVYENQAFMQFDVGLNRRELSSNTVSTVYGPTGSESETGEAGTSGTSGDGTGSEGEAEAEADSGSTDDSGAGQDEAPSGCACSSTTPSPLAWAWLGLFPLSLRRRRTRS